MFNETNSEHKWQRPKTLVVVVAMLFLSEMPLLRLPIYVGFLLDKLGNRKNVIFNRNSIEVDINIVA